MSIRKELAQQLVERLVDHFPCGITIYDKNSKVVASSNDVQAKLQKDAAEHIIHNAGKKKEQGEGHGFPPAAQDGSLTLPIFCGEEVIGAVGLTGTQEVLSCIAWAVKTSVETVMDYECHKEAELRRQDTKNQFFSRLLYHYIQDQREIEDFAKKLGYQRGIIRVPILFQLTADQNAMDILSAVKQNAYHDKQHMTFITTDKDVLVFKPVEKEGTKVFLRFRSEVERYIYEARKEIQKAGLSEPDAYYVGSYQEYFLQYKDSYRHSLWLASHIQKKQRGVAQVYFFTDYVIQYIFESIPASSFSQIFSFVGSYLDRSTKTMIIRTIEALQQNNMSIKAAAEQLKVHRNTISFRLAKIREQLGLDPMSKSSDLRLVYMLVEYLKVLRRTGIDEAEIIPENYPQQHVPDLTGDDSCRMGKQQG